MRTNKIAFTILALMIVASFILSACATATTVAPVEPVVTEAPVVPEVPATSGTSVKELLNPSSMPARQKASYHDQ